MLNIRTLMECSDSLISGLGGKNLQANVLLTSFLIPGVLFSQFFCNNLIFWGYGSSAALPFPTLVILLGLWFVVYVPLVFIGSYVAFKQKSFEVPCAINEIPRSIPKRKFLTSLTPVIGGILPFGCLFIQLFFILNSI
ncbi:Transmembrane 9 superfamily member 2 [Holothuria leucospilota]|uniref:Transmembrane 9 superfamily member n=1 Tax=Holothuria leucospilota TaxID=206669 RepID=A0A9Q1BP92_HOLLE|nr:Transmembrane 9 superfamily member 2 [Holothuria leucospilota]